MENKNKIGIIEGGNLYQLDFLKDLRFEKILTSYGDAFYYSYHSIPFILRHGPERNILPHTINHQANIFVFKKMGIKKVFAFNSVGSLTKRIKPGMFLIPHDYINFDSETCLKQERRHIIPEISQEARNDLINISKKLKLLFKSKGIYFQTKGPRYETKKEVKIIKKFAQVVGMTMGKEATLAKEMEIKYASICCIDNYANGVIKESLTQEEIEKHDKEMIKTVSKIVQEILRISL